MSLNKFIALSFIPQNFCTIFIYLGEGYQLIFPQISTAVCVHSSRGKLYVGLTIRIST